MHRHLLWPAALAVALSSCGLGEDEPDPLDVEPPGGEVNPSASAAQELVSMPACHTALASWDGTTAYSNGPYTGSGTSCGSTGAYGYRYQCVELVMRHFKQHWSLRWYGNAKNLLDNAPRDSVNVHLNGDTAHPPVPGDMLVWTSGTYGHVALITAVRAGAVDIIEQNVAGNGRATLPFSAGRIGARWGSWVPKGWAHAKANAAAPPTPPAWSCGRSSYRGQQLWTCSAGALNKCVNGAPVKVDCPSGCNVLPLGTDDTCR